MINKSDIIDGGLIITGMGISLSDLQNILSIVILVLDLLWIAFKICRKIFPKLKEYLKDGKLDHDETNDLINDIKEEINKKDGDD